jgi:hypothetical protein
MTTEQIRASLARGKLFSTRVQATSNRVAKKGASSKGSVPNTMSKQSKSNDSESTKIVASAISSRMTERSQTTLPTFRSTRTKSGAITRKVSKWCEKNTIPEIPPPDFDQLPHNTIPEIPPPDLHQLPHNTIPEIPPPDLDQLPHKVWIHPQAGQGRPPQWDLSLWEKTKEKAEKLRIKVCKDTNKKWKRPQQPYGQYIHDCREPETGGCHVIEGSTVYWTRQEQQAYEKMNRYLYQPEHLNGTADVVGTAAGGVADPTFKPTEEPELEADDRSAKAGECAHTPLSLVPTKERKYSHYVAPALKGQSSSRKRLEKVQLYLRRLPAATRCGREAAKKDWEDREFHRYCNRNSDLGGMCRIGGCWIPPLRAGWIGFTDRLRQPIC